MEKRSGHSDASKIEHNNDNERIERITEILAEGVYAYLKRSGLLREDMERTERIKRIVEKAKETSNPWQEETEREDS